MSDQVTKRTTAAAVPCSHGQAVVTEVAVDGGTHAIKRASLYADWCIKPDALQTLGKLGEGSFASVERAWYTPKEGARVMVAVKRVKPHILAKPAELQMFIEEAALLRKLRHKNIVSVLGVGELHAGPTIHTAYMVQEYLSGGTLKSLVTRQMLMGPGRNGYSDLDAITLCLQMAEGLAYLHSRQPMVIHRDLKLENVLLAHEKGKGGYMVKIADFGLSKRLECKLQRLAAVRFSRPSLAASISSSRALKRGSSGASRCSQFTVEDGEEEEEENQQQQLDQLDNPNSNKHQLQQPEDAPTNQNRRATSFPPLVLGLKLEDDWWDKMRTFSSHLMHSPWSGRTAHLPLESLREASAKYELTGQTGSLMYMAPEVYNGQPYNEKADVFSFGMMMYEVMQRYMNIHAVAVQGTFEEIAHYAARVAKGYRPPISPKLPSIIVGLIERCWSQDPSQRPRMPYVQEQLQAAFELEQERLAAAKNNPESGCSCVIC